jgi:hypothetical protein
MAGVNKKGRERAVARPLFTPEELEELRRADEELDAEFIQTQEEIIASRKRDRDSVLDNMDRRCRKIAENQRAYYEANREKIAENQRAYREANREKYNAYMREYLKKRRENAKLAQC